MHGFHIATSIFIKDIKHHKESHLFLGCVEKIHIVPLKKVTSLHLIEWLRSSFPFLGSLEHQKAALAPCGSSLQNWGHPMLPLIHLTGSQRRSISHHLLKLESLGKKDKDMGVSKNRGTPKWMVYNKRNLLKWMIWGPTPIFGNTHMTRGVGFS